MPRSLSRTLVTVSVAAAFLLAGCSGTDGADEAAPTEPTTTATGMAPAESPTQASPSPTAPATDGAVSDVALTAIATAVASVPGSRAFSYDRDDRDRYIEVGVIDAQSVERVAVLDITGTRVTRTENEGRLDSSDLADFNAATVGMVDAITTAQAGTPGVLREADLEDPNQTIVWEIQLGDGASPTTVVVDARTGAITP